MRDTTKVSHGVPKQERHTTAREAELPESSSLSGLPNMGLTMRMHRPLTWRGGPGQRTVPGKDLSAPPIIALQELQRALRTHESRKGFGAAGPESLDTLTGLPAPTPRFQTAGMEGETVSLAQEPPTLRSCRFCAGIGLSGSRR